MESVVGVEANDEGKVEESGVEKNNSTLSSPKSIADPVVYKLVRVEGDGRFVPATDDELMEVEDSFEDDKSEMCAVADTGHSVGYLSLQGSSSGNPELQRLEGLSQPENVKADKEKLKARMEETIHTGAPSENHSCISQSGNAGECSKPPDGVLKSRSSPSAVCTSSKPDFSRLKGEICLDNLSIRELHELFRAIFGRETTVKDKLWLKRRMVMGLTNSCDVTATSFTIKDGKLVTGGTEESCMDIIKDGKFRDSPTPRGSENEDHQNVAFKRSRSRSMELDCGSEDHMEQTVAKRIRKPTRRYIEELSEVESRDYSQRVTTSSKSTGDRQTSSKSFARPVKIISSDGKTVVTRLDSLGGSGVHVPCVSRIRRSRPRKNIMALMKFNPSGLGMEAKLIKKTYGVCGSQLNSGGDEVLEVRSTPDKEHLLAIQLEKDNPSSEMDTNDVEKNLGLKQEDSSADTLDDNIITVPTMKGGMRRKHHRAWTLVEVMKLVEGVAKCGAGRWSEIKSLAFASCSYRTSVDLKDKWRNLLKASFAPTPPDSGINSRKHASAPIPAPILIRVRELAEMHDQVPPNLSSRKMSDLGGISANEMGSDACNIVNSKI